jgi:dGTPase
MRTRAELESIEQERLAPFAQKSAESQGREHSEPRHPQRTEYERDRARIIHSQAFRRLEYKTQVFLNGTGDHLRTRLTHTIEVASISRTIARGLGLNEDLTEAIALAHDLGHPPFGHTGEATLARLMREHGGFDHNEQSLRVVERIEKKYPRFAGLNLTWEVREGLRKHSGDFSAPGAAATCPNPSLEAQVADIADEITYYSHDLDDGLDAGLLSIPQLSALDVWQESSEHVRRHFPKLKGKEFAGYVIRCIIDRQVQDVIATSAARIAKAKIASTLDARRHPRKLIAYGKALASANRALRRFLYRDLYYHREVASINERACQLLARVFEACIDDPSPLGRSSSRRISTDGLHRTVCDYISGMTDRFLLSEHERLFGSRWVG